MITEAGDPRGSPACLFVEGHDNSKATRQVGTPAKTRFLGPGRRGLRRGFLPPGVGGLFRGPVRETQSPRAECVLGPDSPDGRRRREGHGCDARGTPPRTAGAGDLLSGWQPLGRQRASSEGGTDGWPAQMASATHHGPTRSAHGKRRPGDSPAERSAGPVGVAQRIVSAYRGRWTIEGAFQTLTDVLRCEVETLGYPQAALFAFATAVPAYNTYAVVKAALRCGHGESTIEEKLSDCHLMDHVARAHSGREVAVDPVAWEPYQRLSARPLARVLVGWAKQVDLARYPKKKRGPKKPRPARKSGDRNHHVATARLLAAQRE